MAVGRPSGDPGTILGTPQFVSALFTVYLLHELKVPGPLRKRQAKNKRQLSNPWQAECSEGDGSGHEKRSGHCRALNATAPMCDNLVWLPRACLLVSAQKKRSEPLFSYLRARWPLQRFHTQRRSGSSFPWQSLPVCVLLLQDLLHSCARGGRRRVEDMCYERRRAEACVDESAHHALVNAGGREIV